MSLTQLADFHFLGGISREKENVVLYCDRMMAQMSRMSTHHVPGLQFPAVFGIKYNHCISPERTRKFEPTSLTKSIQRTYVRLPQTYGYSFTYRYDNLHAIFVLLVPHIVQQPKSPRHAFLRVE